MYLEATFTHYLLMQLLTSISIARFEFFNGKHCAVGSMAGDWDGGCKSQYLQALGTERDLHGTRLVWKGSGIQGGFYVPTISAFHCEPKLAVEIDVVRWTGFSTAFDWWQTYNLSVSSYLVRSIVSKTRKGTLHVSRNIFVSNLSLCFI